MEIKEMRREGVEWNASQSVPLVVTHQVTEKVWNSVTNSANVMLQGVKPEISGKLKL